MIRPRVMQSDQGSVAVETGLGGELHSQDTVFRVIHWVTGEQLPGGHLDPLDLGTPGLYDEDRLRTEGWIELVSEVRDD